MSEMTDSATVPTLTLGWRLQMALAQSPHSRTAIARALGVDASTVGRWMNDKGAPPKKAYIAQWAWLTQVPAEWLETGTVHSPDPDVTTSRNPRGSRPVSVISPERRVCDYPVDNHVASAAPLQLPATGEIRRAA